MDSFRIKIRDGCYRIEDQSYFDEVRGSSFGNARHSVTRTSNAYRREVVKSGIYVPKYHLADSDIGSPEKSLVLEFSAPKLLYGTNLREVSESDFPAVVGKLYDFLQSIKVKVFRAEVESAVVTLVAYAKNICVDEFGSAQEIIRALAPFDYRPRSQYTQVLLRQKEKTSELKYFNNTSHLTIYDKLAEVQSRPMTEQEQAIANYLTNGSNREQYESWVRQTLRVELTLHNKVAVKQVLARRLGIQKISFTFREAFSDRVCAAVLQKEMDEVFNHPLRKIVLLTVLDRGDFSRVVGENCKTLAQYRELRAALDTIYTRGLAAYREDVLSKTTSRTWFRKLERLKELSCKLRLPARVTQLDNARLLEFILGEFGIRPQVRAVEQLSLFQSK